MRTYILIEAHFKGLTINVIEFFIYCPEHVGFSTKTEMSKGITFFLSSSI